MLMHKMSAEGAKQAPLSSGNWPQEHILILGSEGSSCEFQGMQGHSDEVTDFQEPRCKLLTTEGLCFCSLVSGNRSPAEDGTQCNLQLKLLNLHRPFN